MKDILFDKLYEEAFKRAKKLVYGDRDDYNKEGIKKTDYFLFKDKGYLQMIHIKKKRLEALEHSKLDKKVDTILDAINYLAFYYAWLVMQRVKECGIIAKEKK